MLQWEGARPPPDRMPEPISVFLEENRKNCCTNGFSRTNFTCNHQKLPEKYSLSSFSSSGFRPINHITVAALL
jgi:hypothetical protein